MKIQISRFTPHQTAKVLAVMTAITSFIFFLPISLLMVIVIIRGENTGTAMAIGTMIGLSLITPIIQGLFIYIFIRFSLWLYNKLSKRIGGIEFEYSEHH
jgi:hypothetical protein